MYKIIGGDGKEYGPVSGDTLRQWIRDGRLNAQTRALSDGAQNWTTLAAIPELVDVFAALPPLSPPHVNASSRASNKVAAGVCGILLGAFGVHKFILGYTRAGLIMLLVTVLTFGIAGIVMSIIGLIEGIVYLAKSDEDFIRIYVDNRKEWF